MSALLQGGEVLSLTGILIPGPYV